MKLNWWSIFGCFHRHPHHWALITSCYCTRTYTQTCETQFDCPFVGMERARCLKYHPWRVLKRKVQNYLCYWFSIKLIQSFVLPWAQGCRELAKWDSKVTIAGLSLICTLHTTCKVDGKNEIAKELLLVAHKFRGKLPVESSVAERATSSQFVASASASFSLSPRRLPLWLPWECCLPTGDVRRHWPLAKKW